MILLAVMGIVLFQALVIVERVFFRRDDGGGACPYCWRVRAREKVMVRR